MQVTSQLALPRLAPERCEARPVAEGWKVGDTYYGSTEELQGQGDKIPDGQTATYQFRDTSFAVAPTALAVGAAIGAVGVPLLSMLVTVASDVASVLLWPDAQGAQGIPSLLESAGIGALTGAAVGSLSLLPPLIQSVHPAAIHGVLNHGLDGKLDFVPAGAQHSVDLDLHRQGPQGQGTAHETWWEEWDRVSWEQYGGYGVNISY